MKKAVVFGGGNIGRSFIVPVLQEAGYHVTIVDISKDLISALKKKKEYTIVIKSDSGNTVRIIRNFDCLCLSDDTAIMDLLCQAELISTSVGLAGIQGVCEFVAKVLPRRKSAASKPLDFILAENIRNGKAYCYDIFRNLLGEEYPLEQELGVVESSIGKMVPIVPEKERSEDALRLFAEPYNTLILDKDGFLNEPPECNSIKLVSPIAPWVDRKLFIHNLGHAAAAYLGRLYLPEKKYIWEIMEDALLRSRVQAVMCESAEALLLEYPEIFDRKDLMEHIEDLVERFSNKALGDTVQRVGRDLRRKLSQSDRIVGAIKLAALHRLPYKNILNVYKAALLFEETRDSNLTDSLISSVANDLNLVELIELVST